MTDPDKARAPRKRPIRPCPICAKPSDEEVYPFCSKRCADIDLGRWLGGHYAIPAAEQDDSAPDPPPNEDEES